MYLDVYVCAAIKENLLDGLMEENARRNAIMDEMAVLNFKPFKPY